MALAPWEPTGERKPSPDYKGEKDIAVIHTAVGKALSIWEHLESVLTRLFQLLCETPHFAACRAYGTIESSHVRAGLLRAALDVFVSRRHPFDAGYLKDMQALLSAYQKAQEYRNNIAHGVVLSFYLSDGSHSKYFLCPASSSTRKVEKLTVHEVYLLGAAYWYKVADIENCSTRFTNMIGETMNIIQGVNKKYAVLKDSEFHP